MTTTLSINDDLLRRLPLPLAQLYRRAHNAKTPLDRHLAAYYLWEASLKLLGCVAVVEYAELGDHDPQLAERLQNLARPALGHWWEFVRQLVPVLAKTGDTGFAAVRDILLAHRRHDLPYAAGLHGALLAGDQERSPGRATVRLSELFDRLVQHRSESIGHGAAGQRSPRFYDRLGCAILGGVAEILDRLDFLAGRRLIYVADVRRMTKGDWLVEQYELTGEAARRLETREYAAGDVARLPSPESVYLAPRVEPDHQTSTTGLKPLGPLLSYDAETTEVFFLNARRGRRRIEYLCYSSGRLKRHEAVVPEHRELLVRVLGQSVAEDQLEQWAARSQTDESPDQEPRPTARRTIAEFELISCIGRGGMGIVYRAWQPSLGRQVALKCLLRTGDAKSEARFGREIHALGRVDHPNLVKIFTSGADGDQWYYAMELIEGTDLATVFDLLTEHDAAEVSQAAWQQAVATACDQVRTNEASVSTDVVLPEPRLSGSEPAAAAEPVDAATGGTTRACGGAADDTTAESRDGDRPWRRVADHDHIAQVVEIVRQVAEAAHALHRSGIIHRDVKPGNIMLPRDGSHAVLMDLGLAQLADESEGRLTRTRQFVGTLRYASPEQVLAVTNLDRRSDIYSLGATLWELLTLRPLYGATSQTPTPQLMLEIQEHDPQRPRKLNSKIPADLEAIVLKCLARERSRRYPTAAELAQDLARWQRGEPVTAHPPTVAYVLSKAIRRYRTLVAAGALLLLVVVAAVGVAFSNIQRARDDAVAANRRLAAANQRLDELNDHLAEANRRAVLKEQVAAQHAREARWARYVSDIRLSAETIRKGESWNAWETLSAHVPEPDAEDLRGFEWWLLRQLCRDEDATFVVHGDVVRAIASAAEGRLLATAGWDGSVKIWDRQLERILNEWQIDGRLYSVAVSGNGRLIAAAGESKQIHIWDLRDGSQAVVLDGHTGTVTSLAFSPDDRVLVSGSDDGTVRIWESAPWREAASLNGHNGYVQDVVFSPSRLLASSDESGAIIVWDVANRSELARLQIAGTPVLCLEFSPTGRQLVAGAGDRGRPAVVRLWDTQTWQVAGELIGCRARVYGVAFSPDEQWIAAGTAEGKVHLWDHSTLQPIGDFQAHGTRVTSLVWVSASDLATAGGDNRAKLWKSVADHARSSEHPHVDAVDAAAGTICSLPAAPVCLTTSPDGRILAAGCQNSLFLIDSLSGTLHRVLTSESGETSAVAFSPRGSLIALGIGSHDGPGEIILWNWETDDRRVLPTRHGRINALAFTSDGRELLSGGSDGRVLVWDVDSGKLARPLVMHNSRVTSLSLTGDLLATASHQGRVTLGHVRTVGGERTFLEQLLISGVCLDAGGRNLAICSLDRHIVLRKVSSDEDQSLRLEGHTDQVHSITFSPDGQSLASASSDGSVRLWNVPTGRFLMELRDPQPSAFATAVFLPHGRALVAGTQRGDLLRWSYDSEDDWNIRTPTSAHGAKR